MAHTIRSLENHLRLGGLELNLRIIADTYGTITNGATSVLKTKLVGDKRVVADIFLHNDANKHLARICIAHEIYHLLMEFELWRKNNRLVWEAVTPSKTIEDECNQFAWQLCFHHDKFNREEGLRSSLIYFPEGMFDAPLTTDISQAENWPKGIGIDPANRFSIRPSIPWL